MSATWVKRPLQRVSFVVALALTSTGRADENSRGIEEIIVTANRRAENVQDIANSIRVLDGEDLERTGATGFEDYIFRVPGADIVDVGLERRIAIRGIGNNGSNGGIGAGASTSPIGLYLNDVAIQGSGVLPDLGLYDVSRIEVLKGPQGTLYGEGAQGGAIRMVLSEADPTAYSSKGELGFGHTLNGSGFDQAQNLALNAPLFGSWAARLVGSRRIDQGYVDFPGRGTRGENDAKNLAGRLHLDGDLWEGLSFSGVVMHQRQRLEQFSLAQPDQGDLVNQDTEPQFADTDFTLAGATFDYDLGFATLTSATGWFRNERAGLHRLALVGAIACAVVCPIVGFEILETPIEEEWIESETLQLAISEELRLVSTGDSWLDWIGGFFYRQRSNRFDIFFSNSASNDPPPVGPGIIKEFGEETFEQFALFGEATIDLPWDLELGLGLRAFREKVALSGQTFLKGALYPIAIAGSGSPDGDFGRRSFDITTTAYTPKVSLAWYADDWRMVYAQVANGVRSGGTNPNALWSTATPLFEPDSLWAFEIGTKTQWLDGLFTANVAAFYNDWRDLQVGTAEPTQVGPLPISQVVVLNVSRAFSRGVEVGLSATPVADLLLDYALTVGDGRIVEGDLAGVIPDDSPIPQLGKLSYSAAIDYAPVAWSLFGFTPAIRFDTQQTSDRFQAPPLETLDSSLAGFQVYGALVAFRSEQWTVSFDVKNLTDVRQELGLSTIEFGTKTIGRPRTWTARLSFQF